MGIGTKATCVGGTSPHKTTVRVGGVLGDEEMTRDKEMTGDEEMATRR